MKDVSAEYIAKEESAQRQPVELYHIWRDGGSNWYYTSGDVSITYDSNEYVPAALKRSLVQYDSQFEVTKMTISAAHIQDPVFDFIAQNPIEILWVSVMKLHREQDPLEADVVFIGQIKGVSFKGISAQVECVGFEHFLNKTIPAWRYQLNCNHQVFDVNCSLDENLFKMTETVALDSTKTVFTGAAFGTKDDGYFIGGKVVFGVEVRTIVEHVGTDITIMYKMSGLVDSDSVDAFPGCDGRRRTCFDKFDNIINNLAFEDIPVENPATRVTW